MGNNSKKLPILLFVSPIGYYYSLCATTENLNDFMVSVHSDLSGCHLHNHTSTSGQKCVCLVIHGDCSLSVIISN